ncbi:MAG: carboxypeptidase-like regulatory domain-containing protein [Candidatus Magnetoovum sp. WYHC-5]|nr:carboxypeptidase-like regulatory domain-containing protein [Candidatus Magnetoovum sp. WYHC-5]
MLKRLLLLFIASITCLMYGCIYYEGPIHGQVIDKETKKPIEGAVVVTIWFKKFIDIGGGHSEYYDSQEAVTDKNGEFWMSGTGLVLFTYLDEYRSIEVFKVGYRYYGSVWLDKEFIFKNIIDRYFLKDKIKIQIVYQIQKRKKGEHSESGRIFLIPYSKSKDMQVKKELDKIYEYEP